jgi:hypothetical protein
MSYADGWAAINLDMPKRVPRTEYSATMHWDLMARVTGTPVTADSPWPVKAEVGKKFMEAWQFDFQWSTLIGGDVFGDQRTSMGHAVYAAGGTDWNTDIHSPFKEPEEVLAFDPWDMFGPRDKAELTRKFEAHYKANCAYYPDAVNMTGIYVTCISGLIDMFGWDLLLAAAGTDPRRFGDLTNRYSRWIGQYYEALAEADVPVVMSHDDMVWTSGPIFAPEWYRTYVFPNLKKHYAPLIDSGKKIMFTADGSYTAFIDDVAACGVHGFILEPLTDMAYIAEKYGRTHVFVGNADTRILLSGTKAQIRAEVERCMAIGKKCPGFFMCVGNHIPPNTPVENAIYYNDVYEALSKRR